MRPPSRHTLGIGLIVLSVLLWVLIPPVYWLPLSSWWKGAIVAALIVLAEIAFWVGSVIAGTHFARKWRLLPRIRAWLGGKRLSDGS